MYKLAEKPVFVDPHVDLILEKDPFKKIEMAGRTCYKSEANITDESAKKFTKGLIKHQHMAMVEHADVTFRLVAPAFGSDSKQLEHLFDYLDDLSDNNYIRHSYHFTKENEHRILISGNARAILERRISDPIYRALISTYPEFNNELFYPEAAENTNAAVVVYEDIIAEIVDVTQYKDLDYNEFLQHMSFTCRFTTDRGVSHEMVRHRPFSFAQESTRYCNYNKDQFGGRVSWCKPSTYDTWTEDQKVAFEYGLLTAEDTYRYLTTHGDYPLQPQQARAILPNALKTEIVVTGPAYEWKHFFNLRSYGTTGAPHPDIKVVADEALEKINEYIRSLEFEYELTF